MLKIVSPTLFPFRFQLQFPTPALNHTLSPYLVKNTFTWFLCHILRPNLKELKVIYTPELQFPYLPPKPCTICGYFHNRFWYYLQEVCNGVFSFLILWAQKSQDKDDPSLQTGNWPVPCPLWLLGAGLYCSSLSVLLFSAPTPLVGVLPLQSILFTYCSPQSPRLKMMVTTVLPFTSHQNGGVIFRFLRFLYVYSVS